MRFGQRLKHFYDALPTPEFPIPVRLMTLDDTVEFFNLVLELKLSEQEKKDLVAFLRVL